MYDLGEEKGTYYITMEYVPGEDLKSFIRRSKQLSIPAAVSIAKQVLEGLSEAHRLGVVHRDLKPSNIMIDKEGNARIMDFGIARSLEQKGITGAGMMIGTPEYMSPEQAETKDVDQRSDIYSLGVILFEMLTGRLPFEGETPLSIAMKHKMEAPPDPTKFNAQIPEDLSLVTLKCLEKDREKRYQRAEELLSELATVEKGIPTKVKAAPKRKPLTSKEITVTFGLKKLLIPATVFIALIIMGLIIWQLLPQKEKENPSIMVINFENHTGDNSYEHLKKVIPNLLITNLEQSGNLEVTTWERMNDLIRQMGKEDTEFIDKELGFELGRMDDIDAIILGSFAKAGDMFATDVKVLDVETKKLIKSVNSKGEGEGSIIRNQIDELSREISKGIGIPKRKIEKEQLRITDVTTSSMEAYTYFLRGREAWQKFYFEDARQNLEKAVELDPTFAVAYLYLSRAYGRLDNPRARNEALEKAKDNSNQATERERLYIEAFYGGTIERNSEKYHLGLKEIEKKYPKEKEVYFLLGTYYRDRSLYDKSLSMYNKAFELDPSNGYTMNAIAYAYGYLGNYEKSLEYLEKYASVSPGDANPFDSMGELYFRMGKLDEAITNYKKSIEIKPAFGSAWSLTYVYAMKENYPEALRWIDHNIISASSPGRKAAGNVYKSFIQIITGQFSKALDSIQKAIDLAEPIGNIGLESMALEMRVIVHFMEGEPELCQKNLESWFDFQKKQDPGNISIHKARYFFYGGLLDLKIGQIDSAKARIDEMRLSLSRIRPGSQTSVQLSFNHDYLQAEILLAEGSADEAITLWKKASPLKITTISTYQAYLFNIPLIRDVLARAYQSKGELDKAIAEYERLITFDPDGENRLLIHPVYHFRLAKLYEEKGWEGKAIEHYEKFLDLWKDADPGIEEIGETRKRVEVLKSSE